MPETLESPTRCSSCRRAIAPGEWACMEYVGRQDVPADPDDPVRPGAYQLELRNCSCGTTLAAMVADASPGVPGNAGEKE